MLEKFLTPLACEIINDKNLKLLNDPSYLVDFIKIIDHFNKTKEFKEDNLYKLFERMANFDDYRDIQKDHDSKFNGIDDCLYICEIYLDDQYLMNILQKIKSDIQSEEAYSSILGVLNNQSHNGKIDKIHIDKINKIKKKYNLFSEEYILKHLKDLSSSGLIESLFNKPDTRYQIYCDAFLRQE